jgi:hypothetical protein
MEGQGENEELYPIAVLIDELKVNLGDPDSVVPTDSYSMTMCS